MLSIIAWLIDRHVWLDASGSLPLGDADINYTECISERRRHHCSCRQLNQETYCSTDVSCSLLLLLMMMMMMTNWLDVA